MATPEELLSLEQGVVDESIGAWKQEVASAKEALLLLAATAIDGDMTPLIPAALDILNALSVPLRIDAAAIAGILSAHWFGYSMATQGLEGELPNVKVSNNSQKAVEGLRQSALESLQEAKDNLTKPLIGSGLESILVAVAPVLQNPAKMERSITWAVNNASNSAVSKIALKTGETMVWISERNGCVHCMAYSGKRSTLTGFPKGLTFGAKPQESSGTLPHPPLHPNCRCTVEVGITDEYAQALEREAVRSILRGFKLPSESDKVRIEAAKRLLDKDPVAPTSVKKYAKQKIKAFEAKQELKAKPKEAVTPKPKTVTKPQSKAVVKPKETPAKAASIEGKDFRSMSNVEKLKAAELMYGKNSSQYREAMKRFGPKRKK